MKKVGPKLVKITISVEQHQLDRIKNILEDPDLMGAGISYSDFIRRAIDFYDLKFIEPKYTKLSEKALERKEGRLTKKAQAAVSPEEFANSLGMPIFTHSDGRRFVMMRAFSNSVASCPLEDIKLAIAAYPEIPSIHKNELHIKMKDTYTDEEILYYPLIF